ncbi:LysR family transcriptional regulator [Variovorax sp. OV329]|uniref:LysR family transcriptional regulator n=1 Tax=Variovorax sp. OV329 TaxID=1882825 RepID=UPI0008F0C330|nr:LysR family transcriptional regulator [Variovorax sp. OV329]SFM02408.1 DNA-binding transcriptional regulator, LysR family [Variovorax sp. OV329]
MDLRRWTHVVAVADRRSFVRAAEQVHLSQPALTRSIQAAEEELGLLLFDRTGSEVVPTPAGEFVVERARQLVFNSRCLERDVALYRNHGLGDTAFGVGPFPATTFLPELLSGLRAEFPGIHLRVEVSNWQLLLKRLREEDIEFFVADTTELPADPALNVRPVRREPGGFYVRAGHPLAKARSSTLQQVWEYGVLAIRLPSAIRNILARALGLASGEDLRLALECDDVKLLARVTLGCDSVLIAAHATVAAEVAAGQLKLLKVGELPKLQAHTGVVMLHGRTPSPMAQLIIGRLPATSP